MEFINKEKTVTILLSAYNGEKYLGEQLDSLIAQVGVKMKIIVRDDGSSDSTRDILNDYKDKGQLTWYSGENLGFAKSFIDLLLTSPDSDYYAFSDQDDVWMPEKLQIAVQTLESKEVLEPCLYFCNQYRWRDGDILGKVRKHKPCFNRYDCMVKNPAFGCTMVFNKSLVELIKMHSPLFIYAHDYTVYQIAMLFGHVYYDHEAHINYRLHGNNENGAGDTFYDLWRTRFKALKKIIHDHNREYMAQQLLVQYKDIIDEETRKIIEVPALYRKNFFCFLKFLFSSKYVFHKFDHDFWLKLRILIHRF